MPDEHKAFATPAAEIHDCNARSYQYLAQYACIGVDLQAWLHSSTRHCCERTSTPLPSWFLMSAGCATWRCTMLLPCGLRSLLLSYLQHAESVHYPENQHSKQPRSPPAQCFLDKKLCIDSMDASAGCEPNNVILMRMK